MQNYGFKNKNWKVSELIANDKMSPSGKRKQTMDTNAQIRKGMSEETKEHGGRFNQMQIKRIVLDHLASNPNYYRNE